MSSFVALLSMSSGLVFAIEGDRFAPQTLFFVAAIALRQSKVQALPNLRENKCC
jgi:hypothetical protein